MRRSSASEGRVHGLYCLRCYAAMEQHHEASRHCERCGFVNLRLDQQLFWTKEPRFVALEAYAKIVIVFGLIGLSGFMVWAMSQRSSFGLGQGWAVGFPIALGVVLWDTASAITRRKSEYRATVVWRVVCAVLAPWPLFLAIALFSGASDFHGNQALGVVALLLGLVLLAGALGLGLFGRWLARWREHRVLAAQAESIPGGRPAS